MSWLSFSLLLLLCIVRNVLGTMNLGSISNSTLMQNGNYTEYIDLGSSWVSNSDVHDIAIRSQRDSMNEVTIDQLPQVGVVLSEALFHSNFIDTDQNLDQNLSYIPQFELLIDMLIWGIQTFVIDIEVGSNYSWVIKDTDYEFADIMSLINDFLVSTDTNLLANVVTILLRVDPVMKVVERRNDTNRTEPVITRTKINFDNNTFTKYPNLNISSVLDSNATRNFKYSPSDLADDRARILQSSTSKLNATSYWPLLPTFLYYRKKRMVVAEITNVFETVNQFYVFDNSILHYDEGNGTIPCPNDVLSFQETKIIGFRYLESQFNENDIKSQVSCGYFPIVSNKYTTANISMLQNLTGPAIIWSWGQDEPIQTNSSRHHGKVTDLTAENCAAFDYMLFNSTSQWVVENCYDHKRALCRSQNNTFEWLVTNNKDAYFEMDGYRGETKCPIGYSFSKPSTPLEQSAIMMYLKEENLIDGSLWIDLNSISVANCWVSGGSYAQCPYQRVVATRNFVAMMVPVTICAFLLLCLAFYLSLLRMPINDNRHKWDKVVSNYAKTETEGVPS